MNNYQKYINLNRYNNIDKYYNAGLSNPYYKSPSYPKVSSEAVKNFVEANRRTYLPINDKRGALDRILDSLMVFNYAIAGGAKSSIEGRGVLPGVGEGLRAGNPLGKGYEKGEIIFSDVLESGGWKPEGIGGKIAKGGVGLALDILLDPLTYLSGGLSGVVKGTGKVGLKATHATAIRKFAEDFGVDVSKGLSVQDATRVILHNNFKSNQTYTDIHELRKGAEILSKEFNKVIGIQPEVRDLTWSLKNGLFGERLFPNAKVFTLAKAENTQKLGDATLAPLTSSIRNSYYGGKLGERFSNIAPLYKLSKTDPEGFYDCVRHIDVVRGLYGDKVTQDLLIREYTKQFADLTPAENKQLLEIMQDPSKWHYVTDMFNYIDTKFGQRRYAKLAVKTQKDVERLEKLKSQREYLENAKKHSEELKDAAVENLAKLEDEVRDELLAIDLKQISDEKTKKEYIKLISEEIEKLKGQKAEITSKAATSSVDESKPVLNTMVKESEKRLAELTTEGEKISKTIKELGKQEDADLQSLYKRMSEIKSEIKAVKINIHKPIIDAYEVSQNITTQRKQLSKLFKMVEEKVSKEELIKHIEENKDLFDKVAKERLDDTINSGKITYAQKQELYDFVKFDKYAFCKQLSQHLSGTDDLITYSTYDRHIETLIKLMKDGVSNEDMLKFIDDNRKWFDGTASFMYDFIAEQLNYERWHKVYDEPLKHVLDVIRKTGKVTAKQQKMLNDLEALKAKRDYWIQVLGGKSIEEMKPIMQKYVNGVLLEGKHKDYIYPKKKSNEKILTKVELPKTDALPQGVIDRLLQEPKYTEIEIKQMIREARAAARTKGATKYQQDKISKEIKATKGQEKKYKNTDEAIEAFRKEKAEIITHQREKASISEDITPEILSEIMSELKYTSAQLRKIYKKSYKEAVSNGYSHYDANKLARNNVLIKKNQKKYINTDEAIKAYKDRQQAKGIDIALVNQKSDYTRIMGEIVEKEEKKRYREIYVNAKLTSFERDEIYNYLIEHYTKLGVKNFGRGHNIMFHKIIDEVEKILVNSKWTHEFSEDMKEVIIGWAIKNYNAKPIIREATDKQVTDALARQIIKREDERRLKHIIDEVCSSDTVDVKLGGKQSASPLLTVQVTDYELTKRGEVLYHAVDAFGRKIYFNPEDVVNIYNRTAPKTIDELVVSSEITKKTINRADELLEEYKALEKEAKFTKDMYSVMKSAEDANYKRITDEIKEANRVLANRKATLRHFEKQGVEKTDIQKSTIEQIEKQISDKEKEIHMLQTNLKAYTQRRLDNIDKLEREFEERSAKIAQEIEEHEAKVFQFEENLNRAEFKNLDKLAKEIEDATNALNSNEIFDTYWRTELGDKRVDRAVLKDKMDVVEVVLNDNVEVSEKVRELANFLRSQMIDWGRGEVTIGKLRQKQLYAHMLDYLPHIATPDGERLFADLPKEGVKGFGQDYGYGKRSFNPYAESRTMVIRKSEDELITKPTIEEKNEFWSDELKGRNAFSETISDIFLVRGLKHNELMYDDKYMRNMLDMFGYDIDYVKPHLSQILPHQMTLNEFEREFRKAEKLAPLAKIPTFSKWQELSKKEIGEVNIPTLSQWGELSQKEIEDFITNTPVIPDWRGYSKKEIIEEFKTNIPTFSQWNESEGKNFRRWLELSGAGKGFDYSDMSPGAIWEQHKQYAERLGLNVEPKIYNVKPGYKPVMNFGMLKDTLRHMTNLHVDTEISDDVYRHLSNPELIEDIRQQVARELANMNIVSMEEARFIEKKLFGEKMSAASEKYIKENYSFEKRAKMFEHYLEFNTKSGEVKASIEDIATPLIEMTDEQIKAMQRTYDFATDSYLETIKRSVISIAKSDYLSHSLSQKLSANYLNRIRIEMDGLSVAELREFLQKTFNNLDELDALRMNAVYNKLDKITSVPLQIKQVNEAIVEKANRMRKIQLLKDNHAMLVLWDKVLHLIKLNQTTVVPAFHARNKLSNTFNNWLLIGKDAVDPELQIASAKTMYYMRKSNAEAIRGLTVDINGTQTSWSDLYHLAMQYGVLNEGFFLQDLGTGFSRGALGKWLNPKYDPTDAKNFVWYKKGAEIGSGIEGQDKLLNFVACLRNGKSVEEAAESSIKALFDYSDITAFERNVMKRIIPYYTWLRKNAPYQLEMMLEDPKKFYYISKIMHGVEGMVNEEDQINRAFVNEFAKDWVQTPFTVKNPHGREEVVMWNPNLPFMDLGRIPDPFNFVPSMIGMFNQMNPMIRVPIEQAMNYNAFFESPIVGEDESQLNRAKHVFNNMAMYNVGRGFVQKSGIDRALHALNATTGLKFLSYDYDAYKAMKLDELRKKYDNPQAQIELAGKVTAGDVLGLAYKGLVEGFEDSFSKAVDTVGDKVMSSRPMKADEYTDALRPISQAKYEKLSDEEKEKYTPPTEKQAIAYHKKAVELEQEQLAKSGAAKKYIWSLFETMHVGERNKEYALGEVVKVTDGDTFNVKIGDEVKTVRMLLIDTPESVKSGVIEQPLASKASEYAKKSLLGKDTKIIFDVEKIDNYNRVLGYVEVDGVDFNEELLKEGLAKVGYIYKSRNRLDKYRSAEKEAFEINKGIWSIPEYAEPGGRGYYQTYYDEAIVRKLNSMAN